MLESAILVAGGISFIAVRLAVKSVYVALGFNSARVHLIENQVRSGSEQAEHNCDRLIGKEFRPKYQGNPDT